MSDKQTALESRAVIDQAKGIVMAHKHCTADEAFQHLVSLSNTSRVKLREVAARLVEQSGG
jgi:AmiR/NasT family two-component response regulator